MTKEEFIKRTNIDITDEEYADIERIYMAAGSMGKDSFCKAYKGITKDCASLMMWLTWSVEEKDKYINKLEQGLRGFNEERLAMAEFLISKAHALEDTDLHSQAVKLIGGKEVVLITMNLGLPLFEGDIKYINDNLR